MSKNYFSYMMMMMVMMMGAAERSRACPGDVEAEPYRAAGYRSWTAVCARPAGPTDEVAGAVITENG